MEVTLAGMFSGSLLLITTVASVTAFVRYPIHTPNQRSNGLLTSFVVAVSVMMQFGFL